MSTVAVLAIFMIAFVAWPLHSLGKVVNDSDRTIWVKPEKGEKPVPVKPGETHKEKHDGLTIPGTNKVYKTGNGIDAKVNKKGEVTTSGGNIIEKGHQWLNGGTKDEKWVDEHKDWKPLMDKSK